MSDAMFEENQVWYRVLRMLNFSIPHADYAASYADDLSQSAAWGASIEATHGRLIDFLQDSPADDGIALDDHLKMARTKAVKPIREMLAPYAVAAATLPSGLMLPFTGRNGLKSLASDRPPPTPDATGDDDTRPRLLSIDIVKANWTVLALRCRAECGIAGREPWLSWPDALEALGLPPLFAHHRFFRQWAVSTTPEVPAAAVVDLQQQLVLHAQASLALALGVSASDLDAAVVFRSNDEVVFDLDVAPASLDDLHAALAAGLDLGAPWLAGEPLCLGSHLHATAYSLHAVESGFIKHITHVDGAAQRLLTTFAVPGHAFWSMTTKYVLGIERKFHHTLEDPICASLHNAGLAPGQVNAAAVADLAAQATAAAADRDFPYGRSAHRHIRIGPSALVPVAPHVFVGSKLDAASPELLAALGIVRVISARAKQSRSVEAARALLRDLDDTPNIGTSDEHAIMFIGPETSAGGAAAAAAFAVARLGSSAAAAKRMR
ncbi:uncharacterized protein AMSG_04295 [Thecamonas trahens ATCC 50062]|uniref:Uncharacterized protein n=1 Tax=Thecamonas trahens ATCC 50062 TaxID=461836 RepID=A0A0L0D6W0_THETB|nr:hypothetical protein AMSG_04295 [Thecamonas trahens ATCC 50062]KNC48064.1 hypothetical protein AMSG_04295 [Thecamonas trahens ATCC 50062]|eukprot:XP_013759079.1 hypothetical protein AMSG_04295 [Thecamonas trahens ATCC 50062]